MSSVYVANVANNQIPEKGVALRSQGLTAQMAHCGVLSEEEVSEINNGTVDEATLFFAMTHNFHHQYWQTVYEKEELETNFNSEYPTPEERVVRCFLTWVTRSVHAEPQVSSKVWFGMANAVRGVALASAADRSLPVLDVGSGNGHILRISL